MNATRIRDLIGIAVVAGVITWVIVRRYYGSLPQVQWYLPLSLAILAAVEFRMARVLRARIRRRPGTTPVNALVAARSLALAKASGLVGAAMAGIWAGLLIHVAPRLSFLSAAGNDTAAASVGVVSSVGLAVAAMYLEYCCRTPKPTDEPKPPRSPRP